MIRRLVGYLVPLGSLEKGPEDTINTGGISGRRIKVGFEGWSRGPVQQQQQRQQQLLVHASVPLSFFSQNVKPQECNSKMPQK